MERRRIFATAGALSATAFAGALALGANLGLFGLARGEEGPGHLGVIDRSTKPVKPVVRTEVIDVPVPAPGPAPAPRYATTRRGNTTQVTSAPTPVVPAPTAATADTGTHEPREPADD